MATTPTNNPIPSESPRDLKFNAGKIDEVVNSANLTYTDRFGVDRLTIEGLRHVARDAISAFGYITVDSFEDGATLTLPNQVLRYKATGEYYRWGGAFPKLVPTGSTPASTGGVLSSAWVGVGDASLRSNLSSVDPGNGDQLIGVKLDATGSSNRTQHEKNKELVSIKDFSGNDTVALNAAISYLSSIGGGIVNIPAGSYTLGKITLKSGVSIRGAGKEYTNISPSAQNLTIFDDSSNPDSGHGMLVTLSGFNINCGNTTGITGIKSISGNRVNVRDVNFYGCAINIEFDRGGNHIIDNVLSSGTSTLKAGQLKLWSSLDTSYGSVFTSVNGYRIENSGTGSVPEAIYLRRAVAVKFDRLITNDSNYTGTCIVIENDCQGICVSNSVIVGFLTGAHFRKGGGIDKPPIVNIFQNVDFDQCQETSIKMEAGELNQINGGSITSSDVGTNQRAVALIGPATKLNSFNNVHVTGYYGTNGAGFLISNAISNRFFNCVVSGSSQGFAFSGTVTDNIILGGDVSSNVVFATTGSLSGAGNSIRNLKGFNSTDKIVTPAMPSSGSSVTNNFGVPARVFINGGTISTISINGIASGFTTGAMLTLNPSESITLNYSSAPVWNWIGG